MSNGIIENAEELKKLYLQTDITNVAAVQSAVKEITENVYVAGKEKYVEALNAASPANIAKAKRYNNIPTPVRYLGWGLMAFFFVMGMIFDDSGLFEESTVTWPYIGFYIGIGIQIYLAVLKNAWNKLTLSGAVIHSALKNSSAPISPINNPIKTSPEQAKPVANDTTVKYVFCSECGRKNKEGAQFCENCGTKL